MAQTLLDDRQMVNRAALSALGNTANRTLDLIMSDINTYFANATSLPTASVLMMRDANANVQANNYISNLATTATAAGNTTLTVASAYFQQFTGTSTQNVILPDATTLKVGQAFCITNRSTGNVTIKTNGGATLQVLTANSQALVAVTNIGTSAGTWDVAYTITGPVPFVQTQVTTDSTTTGTAATLLTADTSFGTVRLTNGSLVSVSGIVAGASGQYMTVENQTGNLILINNNDSGATAANRIFTGTGANVTMSNNASFTFVYDTTQSRWMLVGGTGSGSGSGSGKNYLSSVITSQSTSPNTGNGNFELGSTTGWSLGTTGTLTNGLPTGSPTFGSGASGNLSISAVSSGQLAGSYSLSYASSAATTQGNMLASDAFYIDTEDQAKVLTWKFYYKAQTNPTNANWSGTSSNSFGVAVYDVTNSAWLPTTAAFGMTQNSGVGYATGTFQTATTTTQLRFVVYNVNATSGAITVYFDDFSVGPQTAPFGPVITDATSYSPTYSAGFGTVTNSQAWWARHGDKMRLWGSFTAGTVAGSVATISIPSGYTVDTNKVPSTANANSVSGWWINNNTTANTQKQGDIVVAGNGTVLQLSVAEYVTSLNAFNNQNGTTVGATGNAFSFWAEIPITGWSSNVQMSSDTDTRVVAAKISSSTGGSYTSGNTTIVPYNTINFDTHGGMSTSNHNYTVPVSGYYRVTGSALIDGVTYTTANVTAISAFVNGSLVVRLCTMPNAATNINLIPQGSALLQLNAGDVVDIRYSSTVTGSPTFDTGAQFVYFEMERVSGPSVIAATESVNMRYHASTTTVTGTAGAVTFSTKDYDTHNAYSGSTYTVPVSGKYQVNSAIEVLGTFATGNNIVISIYKNGSVYSESILEFPSSTGSTNMVSDIVQCNAGDTLQIFISSNSTSPSITSAAGRVYFSLARVGN